MNCISTKLKPSGTDEVEIKLFTLARTNLTAGGRKRTEIESSGFQPTGRRKRYRPNMLASNSESPLTMYTRMYAHKEWQLVKIFDSDLQKCTVLTYKYTRLQSITPIETNRIASSPPENVTSKCDNRADEECKEVKNASSFIFYFFFALEPFFFNLISFKRSADRSRDEKWRDPDGGDGGAAGRGRRSWAYWNRG